MACFSPIQLTPNWGRALAGRPDLGLVAVASWTGLCLLLHGLQLLQAWSRWRRDGKLTSWMTEAAG